MPRFLRHIISRASRADAGFPCAATLEGRNARVLFFVSGVLKRLRGGALGAEMDRIASYFSSLGYKRASAKIYLSRIARFGRFAAEHCRSGPISEGIVDGYLGTFTTDPARIGAVSALQHARRVAPERFIVASTLCSR